MNTDFIIYLMLLTGLFFGWLYAYVTYRRKLVALKKQHRKELRLAENASWCIGFNSGWQSLADSPIVIKDICNQYFHTHRP